MNADSLYRRLGRVIAEFFRPTSEGYVFDRQTENVPDSVRGQGELERARSACMVNDKMVFDY